MAIPFSRSIRSVQADRGKITLLGILFSSLLLITWLFWFLTSKIEVKQMTTDVVPHKQGDVFAFYPRQNALKIRIGQEARYSLLNTQEEIAPFIPAQVMDIISDRKSGKIKVKLSQEPGFYSFQVGPETPIEVSIVVEKVSPAILLLEKTGLLNSKQDVRAIH